MTSTLHAWLLQLADPLGLARPLPANRLTAADLPLLSTLAKSHAVLATVSHHLSVLHQQQRLAEILHASPDAAPAFLASQKQAAPQLIKLAAMSLFLRTKGEAAVAAFAEAGIPALIIKGPLFADRLYKPSTLRPFVDIDLLIPRFAWDRVPAVMACIDFHPHDTAMKYDDGYGEQGFVHKDFPGCSVEVHWNLVNSPTLRRGISVSFEDLAESAAVPTVPHAIPPASMLLIATVHAAASHSFDKIQHLVDIAQIARGTAGPVDADALAEVANRCGATLALATGLSLASDAFAESRCTDLLHALRIRPPFLARALLTPAVVARGQSSTRRRDSWRRQIFRHLLKRSSPPPQTAAATPPSPLK